MGSLDETRVRCILADDHPVVVDSVRRLLERHEIDVVGVAGNGSEAKRLIEELKPDVAVLDIRMPVLSGIEVTSALHDRSDTSIVLYTGFGERALLM